MSEFMSGIDAKAAAWAVRLDAGDMDAGQRAELAAWLVADRRHRGALLRAQAGLRLMDHGQVDSKMLPPPPIVGHRREAARVRSRLAWGGGLSIAAGLAAAAVFWGLPAGDFRTEIGEQRRVALQDGSVAMINTDSRVAVRLGGPERRITLRRGEAWFQVAKDHVHPFIVDAGAVHVRATGTAFSVRRVAEGAEVVVTEGRVVTWRDGSGQPPVAVSAGQSALVVADAARPIRAQAARTDDVLAWRRGEIVFDGDTVAAAVEEFNRYNARKIVLGDPAIGRRTIVGYFLIDQPEKFALAASRMIGGATHEDKDRIVIETSQ
jgi:transmembrane sensor